MEPVNSGKIYGMGTQTLWQRFLTLGYPMPFDEANRLHYTWDKTFPKLENINNVVTTSIITMWPH